MSTDIENKKKEKNEVISDSNIIGNWKLFLKKLGESLGKFLVIIAIGSIINSVFHNLDEEEVKRNLDYLFPTDINQLPYCWEGKCDKDKVKFPFNFPYQQRSDRPNFEPDGRSVKGDGGSSVNWLMDFYEYTCIQSFSTSRGLLKKLYEGFYSLDKSNGGFVVFYGVSYLVYLVMFNSIFRAIFTSVFPIILFILFFILTLSREGDKAYYMWSLFPLSYMIRYIRLAGEAVYEKGKNGLGTFFYNLLLVVLSAMLGMFVAPFNMFFIYMIAFCVMLYILIILNPVIAFNMGRSKMLNVIKSYGRSICAIVTIIIMYTSYTTLNLNVSLGTLVVGFYILFKLLFRDEESGFPGTSSANKPKVTIKK